MEILLDEAGLLGSLERLQVETAIRKFTEATNATLCVQIVRSVPGRRFREHATEARRKHAGDETGSLILVVSIEDRHAEIATAPAYAGTFTSRTTAGLLQSSFVPLMRQGRSVEAIVSAVEAMGRMLQGGGRSPAAEMTRRLRGNSVAAIVSIVGLLALFGSGLVCGRFREHKCVECGARGKVTATVLRPATESAEGLKEVRFSCPKCSFTSVRQAAIPRVTHDSSYSSSDSSSFESGSSGSDSGGGGSDGGGGADW